MDVSHGGQILVSTMTRALLDGDDLTDLGEYHLKDLTRPERVFQVGTIAFPPLRRTGRLVLLPAPLTSLHGRVDELVELDRWLEQSFPPDTLAELKARGRALNPTEIHALVHQMIDKHLG